MYVTVTSKFRVVIPKKIREQLNIQKGQKVVVTARDGIVVVSPKAETSREAV